MKTRLLAILAISMGIAALPAPSVADEGTLATPERALELGRYAGTWYEIARQPHFFQRKCAGDVTATYSLEADHVKVVNACRKENGEVMSVKGKAFILDKETNRKLEVGFLEIFGWMPFTGDYWVLDFDPEYRWSIVGGRDRELGWILSRTKTLDEQTRADIEARLVKLGYEPKAFIETLQE